MKNLIVKALAAVGLVPVRRFEDLSRRVKDLDQDVAAWKKRATKALRRERALEDEVRSLEKRLQKQSRWMATATEQQSGELTAIEEQLAETQRELTLTREHLMTIEVKLDILEGAANVLDARTRTHIIGSTAGSASRTSSSV